MWASRWRRALAERADAALADDSYDRPYRRARALFVAERYDEALAAFEARVRERPISYSARLGVALCLHELGRAQRARETFAELTLDAGARSLAFEHLGHDEVDLDDWVRELMKHGDTQRALALARLMPRRHSEYQAWCLLEMGRAAQALSLVRRGRVGGELAADVLMATGFTDEAAEIYEGLSRGPRTSWYHHAGDERKVTGIVGAARVALRRGDMTRAVRHARRALEIDKRSAPARLVEAAALARLGLADAARAVMKGLARAHPLEHVSVDDVTQSELEHELGLSSARRDALDAADASFAARRFVEAATSYRRALGTRGPKLAPRPLAARGRWAYALAMAGDVTGAAEVAGALAAVDADHLTAREIRCWALAQAGAAQPDLAHSRALFRACGLGVQLVSDSPHAADVSWRSFIALPPERALRHARSSLVARATDLAYYGHWREALEVFAACKLVRGEGARFIAAHAASQLARFDEVWRYLEPLLAARASVSYYAQPLDPWVLALEALVATAQPDKALEVHGTLRRIWGDREEGARGLLLSRADELAAQACEALRQGDRAAELRAAGQTLEAALPQMEGLTRARALHARAFELERAGRVDEALALYAESLAEDAAAADVAGNAANLLVHRGDLGRAYTFFAHGLLGVAELAPPLRRSWFYGKLAWCALQAGAYAAGAAIGRRAAQLSGSPGDWHTVARCELAAGAPERARAALGRGLQQDPRLPQLHALIDELGWPPSWSGLEPRR
ncbi:MAG: tetratricopeptide repeat protein [Myxococcales bacterium]|nr:tetratricopeptide repeat protein [Myxococcales bacterium]